jgi:hypothetical protein
MAAVASGHRRRQVLAIPRRRVAAEGTGPLLSHRERRQGCAGLIADDAPLGPAG